MEERKNTNVASSKNLVKTTEQEFEHVLKMCREIFLAKMTDYGTSWRILRPTSMTDQIYIKAQRIRSIEEKGINLVPEGAFAEFIGIVNYCTIALIQLDLGTSEESLDQTETIRLYDEKIASAKALMLQKNHDYGEAWRQMRISSYTDLILMKIKRTKQIEDNMGKTLISEGVEANYLDMINYSAFGLIKLQALA